MFIKLLRPALVSLLVFTFITGLIYPLVVTALAQMLFPYQANGSLLETGAGLAGSELIGQWFSSPAYFWPRPSNTADYPYNASASGGTYYSVLNEALRDEVQKRVTAFSGSECASDMPVDLATASGSGLDPHISPAAALCQAGRVAQARGLSRDQVEQLIAAHTEARQFFFLGEARVNVLKLNLALDEMAREH